MWENGANFPAFEPACDKRGLNKHDIVGFFDRVRLKCAKFSYRVEKKIIYVAKAVTFWKSDGVQCDIQTDRISKLRLDPKRCEDCC